MSVQTHIVSEDEADLRLDRWFRRHFPDLTQGALQKLCRTGQVRVDGGRVAGASRLAPGQTIRVPPLPQPSVPAASEAPAPLDPLLAKEIERMVIYRDEKIIVLDKPSGLPTQGGPGITKHVDMMLDGLRDGRADRPRLVHRIDRDTSGLLLVARTPGVAAKLAAAFRGRDVKKTYWAVVVGRPMPGEGVIDQPLARLGAGNGALVIAASRDDEDAASARTEYVTVDAAGRKMAWLALSPLTGRTHQLRVHCETIGTPILGDPRYGGKAAHPEGFADRLHLHARALDLPHPDGGRLIVAAGLPPHMRETFRDLGFSPGETPAPQRIHGPKPAAAAVKAVRRTVGGGRTGR
ncbi:RluA family pseudouridine synthase [Acidomonas methanolica]|uniref:Pseudouridine synthase n=1 Tax=Acidomonas methanolica NBRC 104435 TaxID=1231351 RepID=A0A023D628_ACIMT|nr:RluA family pseudouridine synthase [Acidomonas methanolica]MBU2654876.1 RluA family pseudouridine synthase [Acidomonas methanolica]TCS24779.1 23S rRNA pseudouridine955/2504/2580 synthase [Acidomonas methanolica]GAJ29170.1 ribosomal 23S RNA pseudouridine synthase RluC [Acidomonas methanolica NBRC 104435]GEK99856.1 pseudouridine synthase [Acidomonas methanolica NBRC 104435]